MKCCFNCKFYDREAHHQCREPQAEWVRYKEKANFCSYFVPNEIQTRPPKPSPIEKSARPDKPQRRVEPEPLNGKSSQKDKRRKRWDSLFKD
jgi:hypothetical protein